MVITQLNGATGNQLFQYAFARKLALLNHVEMKVDAGLFDPKWGNPRWYSLKDFRVTAEIATAEEVAAYKDHQPNLWQQLLANLSGKHAIFDIAETNLYKFDPEMLKLWGNAYLQGFWQSYKYFSGIEDILLKEFQVKPEPNAESAELLKIAKDTNSVSLHVRRSDYITDKAANGYLGVLGMEYYDQAIALIKERVENPVFFILSDDPEWVRANIQTGCRNEYSHNPILRGYEDLRIMYSCKHNIIANSTFSWWGAWLNQNPDKIVIAPQRWHRQEGIDTTDLVPSSWLRL